MTDDDRIAAEALELDANTSPLDPARGSKLRDVARALREPHLRRDLDGRALGLAALALGTAAYCAEGDARRLDRIEPEANGHRSRAEALRRVATRLESPRPSTPADARKGGGA